MTRPLSLLVSILSVFFLLSCHSDKKKSVSNSNAFSESIGAFTSGVIGINDDIRINLISAPGSLSGGQVPSDLFTFEPNVSGKTSLLEGHIVIFHPDKPLHSGKIYKVVFHLDKIKSVPDAQRQFEFQVRTVEADYLVNIEGIKCSRVNSETKTEINGTITTSDIFSNDKVEKLIHADQSGSELPIRWIHNGSHIEHHFTVQKINRTVDAGKVIMNWNGKSINADSQGEQVVVIPALGDFVLTGSKTMQGSSSIELTFSDPLATDQETAGLFTMQGVGFEVSIEDNKVRLIPVEDISGKRNLEIFNGLKNYQGNRLGKNTLVEINFKSENPAIRFVGKGNIIPGTEGLVIPFEAVNLSAVGIRIVKIFSNNYSQFFQTNNLDQYNSLKNVGRPVYRGVLSLSGIHAGILNKWSAYSFKINDLIKVEPGAIYQVQLSMRPEYSLYPCNDDSPIKNVKRKIDTNEEDKWLSPSYMDEEENWYEYEGNQYDWKNRNNPCSLAYYIENRNTSKNVIASNIGLIAKRGIDNRLLVIATNLLSAQPQPGTEISVLDFQSQVISVGKTDAQGIVSLDLSRTPFLIVAKNGNDIGYLKITDEVSLQLSRFDIGGNEVLKGLKGYLYGERGVWRPGDSIFVSLVIQDKIQKTAMDHPVIFELFSPTEQLEQRIVLPLHGNIITLKTTTKSDSPTGNWRLSAKIGGAEFTKRIRIETVKPNRLKLQFTTSAEPLQSGGNSQTGLLTAKWLQGGLAPSLRAKVDMTLKKGTTTFANYSSYCFDSHVVKFESSEQTIFDGKLNEKGEISFPINPGTLSNAPGKLEAIFTTRVFEPGGDFSITQVSKHVSPFTKYVGIRFPDEEPSHSMLSCGKDNELEIIVVDPSGNPAESKVEVSAYKIDWRWWWDASEDYLANYVTREEYRPLLNKQINTSSGKATISFNVSNDNWGRYLFIAKLPNGHSVSRTVYLDWPYGSSGGREGGATMLNFSADREKYKVGDEISVSFPSSKDGKAFVSIENGTSILDKFWVDTKANQTKVSFKAKAEMSPNIYLSITYLQPHDQTVNDRPIRLYGVIPVSVENPETHLLPVIKMQDELRSQKPFTVEISEKNGTAMDYTLAIVDEGLLDITGYKTPDPWNTFFAREALGVKTWDLFDYVLGAFGGKLEKLFAVGGSDQLPDPSKQKAQRFKPVVRFLGPFTLGKNGRQTHNITLPQYTGSIRLMVVGASENAYGSIEKTVSVRDPLMIMATVPRTVGINESFELPVSVFTQGSTIKDVQVEVTHNSLFSVIGSDKLHVNFIEPGEKDLGFSLVAGSKTGKGLIEVIARSSNLTAVYSVEVNVQNPAPLVVTHHSEVIIGQKSKEFSVMPSETPGTGQATLEISYAPPMNLGSRLDYLIEYPHGCIEQTVSSAFSQLCVNQLITLDSQRKHEVELNIKSGIEHIRRFQLADGSFSYWPGSNYPSLWGTSWTGNFLLEAENLGFAVPQDVKKHWLNFQKNASNVWRKELSDRGMVLDQAYRLYTLALAGSPALGAMNRLRESPGLPIEARWKLAAAYILAGRPEVADQLVDMTKLEPTEYHGEGSTFGSSLRDKAILLETLTLMKKKSDAYNIAKLISSEMCNDQWMSTQTTAACLLAMSQFAGKDINPGQIKKIGITINGKREEIPITQAGYLKHFMNLDSKLTINIENLSDPDVFINITQKGVPLNKNIISKHNGLVLDVAYKGSDGKSIDLQNIPKGTDFSAVVRIKNTGLVQVNNLALTQIFPSGWEIINERLFGGDPTSQFDYRDIRDDRVMTYFSLKFNEQKEFKVKLNATYSGSYYLQPVVCEAMYNGAISANTSGQRTVVER